MPDVPSALLRPVVSVVNHWPWLARTVNRLAIDAVVNSCRHRPHPWSTVSPYTSWRALSDRRFSARHLPAKPRAYAKTPQEVAAAFGRKGAAQVLSDKSTLLFPAFAQYLTDGFIRTRPQVGSDPPEVRKQNTSNHDIDLCPLYGRTVEQTDALRLKSDDPCRWGRLKTQTREDGDYPPFLFDSGGATKPEFLPLDPPLGLNVAKTAPEILAAIFAVGGDRVNTAPQVAAMNALFLREHNRLAGEMARAYGRLPGWDEERVFQTARNVNLVQFIKIVVEEYINHISPTPIRFMADPTVAWNAPWNKPNWITTEFSLLYRWHSLIPDTVEWAGTTHPVAATFKDNRGLLAAGLLGAFEGLSRQKAARLGALNTAASLVPVEELAIAQGRLCDVAPYADYRRYMGFPEPKAFADVSKRPEVVAMLGSLYESVEDVEFYVGLFAEDDDLNSPLPPLLEKMVAVDAFSQALTNPLLSEHVYREETFTALGWDCLGRTDCLRHVLDRNVPGGVGDATITMTQPTWRHRW